MDDEFSFNRRRDTSNKLRADGYYFHYDRRYNYFNIYFFYKNGVLLYGTSVYDTEIENMEKNYKNGNFYQLAKDDINYWGIFFIEEDSIMLETKRKYKTQLVVGRYKGEIINDSTFIITTYVSANGDYPQVLNETYYFKPLSPKPDSTNPFIK